MEAGLIFAALILAVLVAITLSGQLSKQPSPFVPVRDGCRPNGQSPLSYGIDDRKWSNAPAQMRAPVQRPEPVQMPEPTERDGTVAPLAYNDIANMVQRDLGVRSGGVAAYIEYGAAPELGLGRLLWSRVLPAQLQKANAGANAPLVDAAGDPYELAPGMPGTLVPEHTGSSYAPANDRPMSLPYWNLAAARSNPDFATDGPFGAAVQSRP